MKVIIVADPTIDSASENLLYDHVENLEIRKAEEFRFKETPVGGTWERINAIAEYNSECFVIQLDADTITLNQPTDVINCVENNCSFVLGTNQGQNLSTLTEAADFARMHKRANVAHIQLEAESLLDKLDLGLSHYVRGCSGFTGFAPSTISKELVCRLSRIFYAELETRWPEWGSEQFMSNLIVSNSDPLKILPISKYLTPGNAKFEGKVFLHLIGSMRFTNFIYFKAVKQFLAKSRI